MSSDKNNVVLGKPLSEIDPTLKQLIEFETERQSRRIIMIPSESICSAPAAEALGSPFVNLYAEGYPPSGWRAQDIERLSDFSFNLAHYRRYADRRFYKGNEYVNFVEAIAQRRAAECFANERVGADSIYANVQPLSGAIANLAVYDALLNDGDKIMGMDLMQGGHLSHGSRFHVSGKRFAVTSYGVDPKTGKLDYDRIREQAIAERPKLIIAGFTSYPWAPDWRAFREIADAAGAKLMADIAHPAGLVIAGAYPSPIGYAHVITFTTHKTLCGPRGAVILSTDKLTANKIDHAIFPGMQGGPHINKIAGIAAAFAYAQTEEFNTLMTRICELSKMLADHLTEAGMKIAYGGTDTHLLLLDLKSIKRKGEEQLRGEIAVRILELVGIVANKNTIPGDETTAEATGVRLGTVWLAQRGITDDDLKKLAELIGRTLAEIKPFSYQGATAVLPRGKVDFAALIDLRREAAELADRLAGKTSEAADYPLKPFPASVAALKDGRADRIIKITGYRSEPFVRNLVAGDVSGIKPGAADVVLLLDGEAKLLAFGALARIGDRVDDRDSGFLLAVGAGVYPRVIDWLRGHSDGYLLFDTSDITAKVEGPVVVEEIAADEPDEKIDEAIAAAYAGIAEAAAGADAAALPADRIALGKPYFIGQPAAATAIGAGDARPEFEPPAEDEQLKRTWLYDKHAAISKKIIPFAGWELPVWYTSGIDEHLAVRNAAGLFDVSHMGVFEISGPNSVDFLDLVTTNYVRWFEIGQSFYSYLLDPDGDVIDDVMIYCIDRNRYLMVVNAANEKKDWAWLNAVNDGAVLIDREIPARRRIAPAVLRDLKDGMWGERRRVDIALQGPVSRKLLHEMLPEHEQERFMALERTGVGEFTLAGQPCWVARTGYTGESFGYEILIHPTGSVALWDEILAAGAKYGVVPTGLAARDSLRTEAGLPLYGHELAGPDNLSPAGAGFASYVKLHKPFFIGKKAYIEKENARTSITVRFMSTARGVRPIKPGDPVLAENGSVIGKVTSCVYDPDRNQVGLAYVGIKSAKRGPISIYPLPDKKSIASPSELKPGDKTVLPIPAEIVVRFPKRQPKPEAVRTEYNTAAEDHD